MLSENIYTLHGLSIHFGAVLPPILQQIGLFGAPEVTYEKNCGIRQTISLHDIFQISRKMVENCAKPVAQKLPQPSVVFYMLYAMNCHQGAHSGQLPPLKGYWWATAPPNMALRNDGLYNLNVCMTLRKIMVTYYCVAQLK